MRHGLVLLLFVLLLPSSGIAQINLQADGVGLYFDLAATQVTTTTSVDWQVVDAYLFVTNASDHGHLIGFYGNCVVELPGEGTGISSPLCNEVYAPEGMALYCQPGLPWSPLIFLGTFSVWVPSPTTPVRLFIRPGEDGLYYQSGSWPAPRPKIPLTPSSGSGGLPVATINAPPPVPSAESTWGSIKQAYR